MKKITLSLFLLTISLGFAQQQQYNFGFETGTPSGVASNWFTFDNGAPAAEIVTNPDPDGVNPSATTKVLKCVMGPGNAFYAGVNNAYAEQKFGTWKIDAAVPSNLTITMDINKNYVGTVGIQMVTTTGGSTFQIVNQNVGNTVVNQWQTLTWTVPAIPPGLETPIAAFVVFVDWTQGGPDRAEGSTIYIDNIRFNAQKLTDPVSCSDGIQNGTETGVDCGGSCAACPGQEPLVAAPTPIQPPANVISMFSNAYTNVPVDTWRTVWSSATLTDLQIAGNDTKKYTLLNFVGIETVTSQINATGMTHFHVDAWTPNMTAFRIKLVDFGANAAFGGGDDKEHELSFTPTLNGWNSYDIPLSDFTGLTTRAHMAQLIFSGNPSGAGTVFIDNVYFRTGTLGIDDLNSRDITIYPNPATNVLNIESAMTIEKVSVYNLLGQEVISQSPNTEIVTLDVASLQVGVYVVKTSINGNVSSTRFIKE
jgi:hypothetical protein